MSKAEDEFVAFYEAHWPKLVVALASSVPDGEDPRDVAQEAFARAFERWRSLREHPRPDAWLFLTGYRLASTLRRRIATRRRHERHADVRQANDWVRDVASHDLLRSVPVRQRTALVLRHYYRLSTRETARAMRCREGTVKSLLSRGRERLRLVLADEELER